MTIQRPHVRVDASDPRARGHQRGSQLRALLAESFDQYLELFTTAGRSTAGVRDDANRTLDALQNWQPRYAEEIEGVAAGAGLEPWQIAALNARTEILSPSGTSLPGECSTIAKRTTRDGVAKIFSIQTWDWHVELDPFWHTHETRGFGHAVVGFTEAGILGKAGINSAGFGTHFNILGHHSDGVGGVPVHILATAILEQCASVEEALDLIRNTPLSASSAFTMVDEHTAVGVEVCPAGVFSVPLVGGHVVRTNHFLTETPQKQEKTALYQPDSSERMELIESRFRDYPEPENGRELLDFLFSEGDEPPLCAVPDMSKPFGERWATLATLILTPEERSAQIVAGSPINNAHGGAWATLIAAR